MSNKILIEETFADDDEKMKDFFVIPKIDFLSSYSYLTEEEYDITKDYILQQIEKLCTLTNNKDQYFGEAIACPPKERKYNG